MTSALKTVYINKLDDIVNIYNNTYHSTIKMKYVDVKSNIYINSSKDINSEDPKFKIGGIVIRSKYNSIFVSRYVSNWSDKVFVIKNVKKHCAVDICY